jgi:hypothetical protein
MRKLCVAASRSSNVGKEKEKKCAYKLMQSKALGCLLCLFVCPSVGKRASNKCCREGKRVHEWVGEVP